MVTSGDRGLDVPPSWPSQVQSMKQANSSLRQALEGGIDPLRPPEVRLTIGWKRGVLSGGRIEKWY